MAAAPPPAAAAANAAGAAAQVAQPPPGAPANVAVAVAPNPLNNRADEPEFKLKIEPERLLFKSAGEGKPLVQDVKLTNNTPKRQTFKIRCTSNEVFRVRPPLGFINPKETVVINVTFSVKTEAEASKHFLAFYHMPTDDTKAPRTLWTAASKPEGVKRIGCGLDAAVEGGAPGEPAAPDAKAK